MSSRVADYDYDLPNDLIAQHPTLRRDESRLLVLHRTLGAWEHRQFTDLKGFCTPDDLLVFNNTRVIPARVRIPGRNAELLLLQRLGELCWRCSVRPGRWFKPGRAWTMPGCAAQVLSIEENGDRVVKFDREPDLAAIGEMPLPPYVERQPDPSDAERYQTVYATEAGAVAAPTAGLHFTEETLRRFPHAFVTLHVGPGTFRPVKVADAADHPMHEEHFRIDATSAAAIGAARSVLAVGTTTVRVLEASMAKHGEVRAGEGTTDLFIRPPYRFRRVDKLLTNFHLPRSTLLMLVSAFAGRELVLAAYADAVRERYRFFSYGDAMLLL